MLRSFDLFARRVAFLFRTLRRAAIVLILLASLAMNVLMVTSDLVYGAVAGLVGGVAEWVMPGRNPVRPQARLKAELDAERQITARMRREAVETSAQLATERRLQKHLRAQISTEIARTAAEHATAASLRAEMAAATARQAATRAKLVGITARVAKRAARTATREIGATTAKAVPFFGTAVIVGATAWEISDLCQTIVDMREMEQALFPQIKPSPEELTVCAMKVPKPREIWASAQAAPAAAWDSAKAVLPDLKSVTDFSFGAEDWAAMRDSASAAATGIVSSVADGTSAAADAVAQKARQLYHWLAD